MVQELQKILETTYQNSYEASYLGLWAYEITRVCGWKFKTT